ncbi:MAG: leucine-rich repeat protein [Ruminococcus sp.]|nr:leucine-rich repeat protein [Ruminococcus sp.]
MNVNDFIRMECSSCGAEIYAAKGLAYWYCGHCGEQLKVTPPAKKKPVVIKLKKRTAPAEGTPVRAEQGVKAPEAAAVQKPETPKAPAPVQSTPKAPAAPAPVQAAPKAPVSAPAPVQEAPKAPAATPAPVQEAPKAPVSAPAPVQEAPKAPVSAPAPVQAAPKAPVSAPAPVQEAPKAPVSAPAPVQAAPKAPVSAPTPVQEASKAPVSEPAPAQAAPKAPVSASAPAQEAPKAPETAPAAETAEEKKPDVPEFEMDLITLKKYHGSALDLELPSSIRKIGAGAFKGNTQLRSIVIPDSVMDIARSAFEDCTELKSVTLPGSLTKIDYKTFNNCKNLKSLTVPGTVVEIAFGSLHCGLEEIILDNPKTSWDVGTADSEPAFNVDRRGDGNGVSRIIFRGTEYNAADVFRFGSMEAYFRSQGLCPRCGGQYNLLKRCRNCNWKKEQ